VFCFCCIVQNAGTDNLYSLSGTAYLSVDCLAEPGNRIPYFASDGNSVSVQKFKKIFRQGVASVKKFSFIFCFNCESITA